MKVQVAVAADVVAFFSDDVDEVVFPPLTRIVTRASWLLLKCQFMTSE